MKRTSTVQRITRQTIAKMKAYMEANNCGFIVRWLGCEVGIVSIDSLGFIATTDEGHRFSLIGMTARYIRKGFC